MADIFLCGSEQVRLYRNMGGMKFEDATEVAGLRGMTCRNGTTSADFDGDGWPDLLMLHDDAKRDHLMRNDHGRFADVTPARGLSTGPAESMSAVWLDYDRDGRLDLYILETAVYCEDLPSRSCGSFQDGLPNRLYRNTGKRFEEVGARAGVADDGRSLAAASFDYDEDGWPDLDIINDYGFNRLYRNQHDGTFREVTRESGADMRGLGMGVSVADFDHDGHMDMFLTYAGQEKPHVRTMSGSTTYRMNALSYYDEGVPRLIQSNRLLRSLGGGHFQDVFAEKVRSVATGWGWNSFFFDADNSGEQDIFEVAGHWPYRLGYSEELPSYWRYDHSAGRYLDRTELSGTGEPGLNRVSGYADFDADGCLDILVTGFHPPLLYKGLCDRKNHWLAVRLEGTRSNRDGIGARVTVRTATKTLVEELGPQGGGFMNSLLRQVRFGLGADGEVQDVEVAWPSGHRQRLGPQTPDRLLVVKEN